MPRAHVGVRGTTLGVVLTFHLVSGQSLFVIGRWDVEAGLASLQLLEILLFATHLTTGTLRLHTCTAVQLYMGSRDLNSGPLFAEASA